MDILPDWPLSAWVTVLPLLGSALWQPATAAARWLNKSSAAAREAEVSEIERLTVRVADLEDLVDLLRAALNKNLIREGAIASACELLIALVRMVPNPDAAMLHMRDRAQQLLVEARAHLSTVKRGPRA